MKNKILILEDEFSIRSFMKLKLKSLGYDVIDFDNSREALSFCDEEVDVALLDVMLPDIDGFEVCRRLKVSFPDMGIIMITAKGSQEDIVTGLNSGADDYIVKPFGAMELEARIASVLRRVERIKHPEKKEKSIEKVGIFTIDNMKKIVTKNDQVIGLTPTEFLILKSLIENKNSTLDRNELLDMVWGEEYVGDSKVVEVNIRRIRQKIEEDPSKPEYIKTIRGYGYMWSHES